jgi:crotonobetainyl-CoA:carnitine CoA-transferase CaiB-like acyl-CoA transferase
MKPLEGIKVVDLTTYMATPATGRVLGEWGADVIKVEAAKGDPCRVTQAAVFNMPMSDDENLAFDMVNLNKRFIALNLKSETGIEVMYKLLEQADIFITNTRNKSLKKLGLDWETLHEKFPRLIMGHGLGYGKKGAEKDDPGFDVTCYMARGGVFGTTVNRGDSPMIPTNGYGDMQASMFLAAGLCAAVIGREKTGEGEYVTCALQHAALYTLIVGMISAQYGNPYPKSRLEVICPFNNVYMTGDGKYIAMCDPEYDRDYNKIMGLIGREDLIDDPKYVNCVKMNEANLNAEVVGIMDDALAKMTSAEALKIFKDAGIPIEPCQTPLDIYEDQNVWDNDYLVKIKYPEAERNIPTAPIQFESVPAPEFVPTGKLGSSTVQVMKDLGYSEDQIQAAIDDGSVAADTSLDDLVG